MDFAVSILLIFSIVIASISISITICLREKYLNKGALWFAFTLVGLSFFLVEILIYRYTNLMVLSISKKLHSSLLAFSDIWLILGGSMVCFSLPRFACYQMKTTEGLKWTIYKWCLPSLSFCTGLAMILPLKNNVAPLLFQMILLFTIVFSFGLVLFYGLNKKGDISQLYISSLMVLSIVCLPFILLDATGKPLPYLPSDIMIPLYVFGVCIISIIDVSKLYGRTTYYQNDELTSEFLKAFNISKREAEIIENVLNGTTNKEIATKLYISGKTVENHLTSIFRKTGTNNRLALYKLIFSST